MIKKTIIANKGLAEQGKSASIILLIQELISKYPHAISEPDSLDFTKDIQVILNINGIKIGIESQGDPKSRLFDSLPMFVERTCDIIICACRNRGETVWAVEEIHKKHEYDIIWVTNPRSWHKRTEEQCHFMNKLFVNQAMSLIEAIINQTI